MQPVSNPAASPLILLTEKDYEDLFKRLYTPLCRFAYKYVVEEEVAEELVQELFIQLWQRKDTLQIQTSLEQYLYASVRNRSLNVVKRKAFLRKAHDHLLREQTLEQDSLNEKIHFQELESAVAESIAGLPDRCRAVFHLSRNEGLSYKEIAKQLEISEKTVENQISIALKKLRENLSGFFTLLGVLLMIDLML